MTKQEKYERNSAINYYTGPNRVTGRVTKTVAAVMASVALAAGIHEYNSHTDKSAHPLKPEVIAKASVNRRVDPSIVGLHLEKDANIRKDPFVPGQEDFPNLIEKLDKSFNIPTNGNVVVEEQTPDGTWYGIPAPSLERVLQRDDPDFHVKGDYDGYIWINHQKADPKKSQLADESNL